MVACNLILMFLLGSPDFIDSHDYGLSKLRGEEQIGCKRACKDGDDCNQTGCSKRRCFDGFCRHIQKDKCHKFCKTDRDCRNTFSRCPSGMKCTGPGGPDGRFKNCQYDKKNVSSEEYPGSSEEYPEASEEYPSSSEDNHFEK